MALPPRARRPSRSFSTCCCPSSLAKLSYEARRAVTAIRRPARADLKRPLDGEPGVRAQALAARTLSRIASPARRGRPHDDREEPPIQD